MAVTQPCGWQCWWPRNQMTVAVCQNSNVIYFPFRAHKKHFCQDVSRDEITDIWLNLWAIVTPYALIFVFQGSGYLFIFRNILCVG